MDLLGAHWFMRSLYSNTLIGNAMVSTIKSEARFGLRQDSQDSICARHTELFPGLPAVHHILYKHDAALTIDIS
ncbi:hypothetical protein RRF57_002200 [Xylaria bambusicola]|uniref:Uncharacterized protein n=1 Tax=Xylaria bambusicola TaxID=326684 RepID=A0AAN7U6L5_9PEZI